jgi:hypothetical protein
MRLGNAFADVKEAMVKYRIPFTAIGVRSDTSTFNGATQERYLLEIVVDRNHGKLRRLRRDIPPDGKVTLSFTKGYPCDAAIEEIKRNSPYKDIVMEMSGKRGYSSLVDADNEEEDQQEPKVSSATSDDLNLSDDISDDEE